MLPDYTIRESTRAKHVRFRITPSEGLTVVIPKGFDRKLIPALLEEKQVWLMRSLKEIEKYRENRPSPDLHPLKIEFPSVGQTWQLDWTETGKSKIAVQETEAFRLRVTGSTQDRSAWQSALRQWLIERGREILIPWTNDLSQELGIPIQRVTVRCQRTRWGSYSSKGTVSLNAQLLLLPRPLASYVLIHEICHAVHPNHSARFWQLVRQWEPDADRFRVELRKARRFIPGWL